MSYNNIRNQEPDLLGDDFILPDEEPTANPFNDPINSDAEQVPNSSTTNSKPQNNAQSHIFHISFYRQFFDLNSDDFFVKIKNSLNPLARIDFNEEQNVNELYGFVWITGTLIFLMFVSSTSSHLINEWLNGDKDKKFDYDFNLLNRSILLFYGYNVIVPILYNLITNWVYKFPENVSLIQVISIYGYTNVLWIPVTVINLIIISVNDSFSFMVNLIKWGIVLFGGFFTGLSNINKLMPVVTKNCLLLQDQNKRMLYSVIGFLILAHLIFTVLIKISFFGLN
ncbi:unnamed protein product [Candida verbasci]|uniref:Protein YIP n=1 Tax=Candida verbasci TaxID=1227364 RepID=A0A9W4TV02_9ASCO|nr:unnamed protein product [Candida verbasci]